VLWGSGCGLLMIIFVASGTGIVGLAMAFACVRAMRLDASRSSAGSDMSSANSGIRADIFMTDLAPYVDAARLTMLQNK
jgi:hypothetical protein